MSNLSWSVGNGTLIKAWTDPWLSLTSQLRPMGPLPENGSDLMVADLLYPETNDWNVEMVHQMFPFIAETILSIKPSKLGAPDKIFWIHTSDGDYKTKTGYAAAVELRNELEDRRQQQPLINWNKGVWNLKTAPKVQVFVWKALRGALPVGEKLLARKISIDPLCKRCGQIESINHFLFQCEFAEKILKEAPFVQGIDGRRLLDLEHDWMRLIDNPCLPPVGITAGQLAPWIAWPSGQSEKNMLFNNKLYSPGETLTKAIVSAKEWLSAQNKEEKRKL